MINFKSFFKKQEQTQEQESIFLSKEEAKKIAEKSELTELNIKIRDNVRRGYSSVLCIIIFKSNIESLRKNGYKVGPQSTKTDNLYSISWEE